jgi:hypothetical protein
LILGAIEISLRSTRFSLSDATPIGVSDVIAATASPVPRLSPSSPERLTKRFPAIIRTAITARKISEFLELKMVSGGEGAVC